MISGKKLLGIIAAVILALGVTGCKQPDNSAEKEEIQRLGSIIKNYEKETQELMRRLQEAQIGDKSTEIEIRKRERKIEALKEAIRRLQGKVKLTQKVEHQLEILAQRLGGTLTGNRLLLPGDYFFDSGRFDLKAESKEGLKALAEILRDEKLMLLIVGHTDSDPVRKSRKRGILNNRHLSLMRSMAVLEELKKNAYPPELMYPSGWGALRPEVANDSKANKARNRRVEIFIDPAASGILSVSAITDVLPAEGQGGVSVEGSAPVIAPATTPAAGQGGPVSIEE